MILKELFDLLDVAKKSINAEYKGMKICELGNQLMKWSKYLTGKKYFIDQGVAEHISIDINGKDGAIRIDLSKPVDKWHNYFDMVTNFGTAEHVSNGIYEAFMNIHNFTRPGGVMINVGPIRGGCPWHSPYHYDADFFNKLSKIAKYRYVLGQTRMTAGRRGFSRTELDKSFVCAVMVKEIDSPFVSKEDFLSLKGIEGL